MIASVPYILKSIAWIVPAGFMYGTAPTFILVWGGWRVVTALLPNKIYEKGDDFLYSLYQKLVLFFFENCSGVKIILSGDVNHLMKDKENVILMMNHQCTVDWMIADMLAVRQRTIGHIRYILKHSLRWVPLYGFYFRQHSCIYVKRSGKFQEDAAKGQLDTIVHNNTPFWMVVFPEGTRYNPALPKVVAKSRQFAQDQGLAPLQNVLFPRYKAMQLCLERLGPNTQAVYDVTVAYSDTVDTETGQRLTAPGLPSFLAGESPELHVHIQRLTLDKVPKDEEKLKHWLYERFQQKDKLLARFYEGKGGQRGTLNSEGRVSPLPLRQTFPVFLFWTAINLPLWFLAPGRQLYLQSSIACTLFGWTWMAFTT